MSGHMNEISTVLNLRQCFRSWPGIKSSVQITHKTENSEYRKWYILEMEKEKNKQTEMPVKNLNKKKSQLQTQISKKQYATVVEAQLQHLELRIETKLVPELYQIS